jgi:uncharacterized protein (TIGR00255 family)
MTGYACRETAEENFFLSVEIRGYNSRYLEIFVNAPPWLSSLEPRIRRRVAGFCGRGKVEVQVRVRDHNAPISVSVNVKAAKAYENAILNLAADLDINERPGLSTLLEMEGVLEVEKNRDDERYWKMIEPVFDDAVGAFNAERVREGKHTEEDILKFLSRIESSLADISSRAPEIELSISENIRTRLSEFQSGGIDENRVLAETAVLLMKYTISEELSRLSSHLAEFRAETAKNQRPGKKLDFLSQEINREINTIGSKSAVLEVSRAVVDMKEALENIREQLRNVE